MGGTGDDSLDATSLTFTETERDFIFNTTSIEVIRDASGVYGDDTPNTLLGASGSETLSGNASNDTLDGGGGADILIGGADADVFVLRTGDGADTISDFQDTVDLLGLAGGLVIADLNIDDGGGGDTTISITATGEVLAVLAGVSDSFVTEADTFIFV